jgi:L-threonylcarbamoyladenylate synthase
MKRPAVFLDRDGTLIEDRGHLGDPAQAVFFPETAAALRRLGGQFSLFIVTNQNGIAKGFTRPDDVRRVNDHVVARLREAGVEIREVYTCPHQRSDGCVCIKPNPHFLRKAEAEHGVDLSRSFVVGDHPADVDLAANAGARGIYVLSGHGEKHRADVRVPCEIVPGISEAVDRIAVAHASGVLRAGGLVAFPTETVYGLGADAGNEGAVRRVFQVKGRPAGHPLIVHVAGSLTGWAAGVPDAARRLAERFWPGPLTIVLRRGPRVLPAVTGGQDTVALRVPAHPLALALLRDFGGGVAAPSANRFGRVSPTTAAHVRDDLGADVEFILDGGPCGVGVESTIVDLSGGAPSLLRPGGVPLEALEEALGTRFAAPGAVRAPGRLESHYAPRAEVVLAEPEELDRRAGELREAGRRVVVLRLPASPEEAARALYASLRESDAAGVEIIVTSLPSESGLGRAMADRLRKAAGARGSCSLPRGE